MISDQTINLKPTVVGPLIWMVKINPLLSAICSSKVCTLTNNYITWTKTLVPRWKEKFGKYSAKGLESRAAVLNRIESGAHFLWPPTPCTLLINVSRIWPGSIITHPWLLLLPHQTVLPTVGSVWLDWLHQNSTTYSLLSDHTPNLKARKQGPTFPFPSSVDPLKHWLK